MYWCRRGKANSNNPVVFVCVVHFSLKLRLGVLCDEPCGPEFMPSTDFRALMPFCFHVQHVFFFLNAPFSLISFFHTHPSPSKHSPSKHSGTLLTGFIIIKFWFKHYDFCFPLLSIKAPPTPHQFPYSSCCSIIEFLVLSPFLWCLWLMPDHTIFSFPFLLTVFGFARQWACYLMYTFLF